MSFGVTTRSREGESSQTEFDDFPNALHQSVEVFGLSVAAPQDRDGGDIVAVFIPFNDNRKLSLSFHETILAPGK